ncbi:hypothetical protein GSUB_16465 (plasmid) [Geoalkalibacter subterraneus]|uniref:Uncharacterized protein n=1 Tax=Geoalkalibacter subterraneus TaxID=483547 RepID=A0A0B5FV97_9BACT|nr:hypothetical protein GSUB_16465 [Geoalkalibacter subterraneus]
MLLPSKRTLPERLQLFKQLGKMHQKLNLLGRLTQYVTGSLHGQRFSGLPHRLQLLKQPGKMHQKCYLLAGLFKHQSR